MPNYIIHCYIIPRAMAKLSEPPAYFKNVAMVRNRRTPKTRVVNLLILLLVLILLVLGFARTTRSYIYTIR